MDLLTPCTEKFSGLLARLDAAGWIDDVAALRSAVEDLGGSHAVAAYVQAEVAAWKDSGLGARDLLCRETATHYKWFIGASAETGAVLWLHDYKPADQRAAAYAQSVHDHRYSFASWILAGAYTHQRYSNDAHPQLVEETRYEAPSSYVMDADEIHGVTGLEHGTLTLILQAPARRSYSTQHDWQGGVKRRHVDFDGRLEEFGRFIETLQA